jgi:hypothetical protein
LNGKKQKDICWTKAEAGGDNNMGIKIWGKLDKKLSRFWGLPTGKGTNYPYNEKYIPTGVDPKKTEEQYAAAVKKETDQSTKDRLAWMDKIKGKKGRSEEE